MVAEMSRHTGTYVMEVMGYARGLQYQNTWYQKRGIHCVKPGDEEKSPLDRIIR